MFLKPWRFENFKLFKINWLLLFQSRIINIHDKESQQRILNLKNREKINEACIILYLHYHGQFVE
jgi:hypothetical protein